MGIGKLTQQALDFYKSKSATAMPDLYNRIITLTFKSKIAGVGFSIKCPETGRKPDISISGTMEQTDNGQNFVIRVKNLYTANIQSNYNEVEVRCGYANKPLVAFTGAITNVYLETPGPDRVTVIQCTTVKFDDWINTHCNIHLNSNFTLQNVLALIERKLNFKPSVIDSALLTATSRARLDFTGTANNALHNLREYFPDVFFFVKDNQIHAYKQAGETKVKHYLKYVSSAPQVSGDHLTISAPWDPEIKPGDCVEFVTKFYKKANALQDAVSFLNNQSKITVWVASIAFSFGTVDGNNNMTLNAYTGTIPGGK